MSPYSVHETLLSVVGVDLSLGGKSILRDVHAEVKNIRRPGLNQGQVVALLGPSGVGKTQLFNLLAGLNKPDNGKVLVTEKLIPVQAGMVGVVPQKFTLFRHRTVLGNLIVAACERGHSTKEAKDLARNYLARFGLSDKEFSYPKELSGGQQQRVAIIQQLLSSEHFLLMDEPVTGLDPLMTDAVSALITEVASSNELNTIIVTTHNINFAVAVADTLWLLGRDRDAAGNSLGARIQKIYDLAAMGLAWDQDIQSKPEFFEVVKEVKMQFKTL
jgi:polar amino acid transport system ATP-binding protein/sulfate transport system ATP-binding protein